MQDLRRELTVRAAPNAMGFPGKPFKVYKLDEHGLVVPRFWGGVTPIQCNTQITNGDPMNPAIKFKSILRPYQKEALDTYTDNGILCFPCGRGKTVTAIAIACKLKRKTLIVVHKDFLGKQWVERIGQSIENATIGYIQGNVYDVEGADFVIAMIQTLLSREVDLSMFGTIIVDEAHHIGAPAFSQIMLGIHPKNTLGLTATPTRKDGLTRILFWFLGPIFYTLKEEAEEESIRIHKIPYTCQRYRGSPIVNALGKISMSEMVTVLTEDVERSGVILEHIRDAQRRNRKSLVLSDRRAHCEYLYSQLDPSKTQIFLGGYKGVPDVSSGTLISTFSLAYEGLDLPGLDTLFLTTPHADITQAFGRITRDGKKNKEVWDYVDQWSIFPNMYFKRHPRPVVPMQCLF